MIVNSLDRVLIAECPEAHARLLLANVTDTARTLERNHLCGPIAGLVQAELIGSVALMGADRLEAPGESLSLRVRLPEGALGGAVLECSRDTTGLSIRGYTRQKVLPGIDDGDDADETLFDRAMGRAAHCAVVRVDAKGASEESHYDLDFDDRLTVTDILEGYFVSALSRNVLAQASAASKIGYVECSHALFCELLPEADDGAYDRVDERFDGGAVQDALDGGADLNAFAHLLGLGPATVVASLPVRFACGCSGAKVMNMLRALPRADLLAMIEERRPTDIYCHMCGKCYTVTPEQLQTLL